MQRPQLRLGASYLSVATDRKPLAPSKNVAIHAATRSRTRADESCKSDAPRWWSVDKLLDDVVERYSAQRCWKSLGHERINTRSKLIPWYRSRLCAMTCNERAHSNTYSVHQQRCVHVLLQCTHTRATESCSPLAVVWYAWLQRYSSAAT
jgi:hypothetical protein